MNNPAEAPAATSAAPSAPSALQLSETEARIKIAQLCGWRGVARMCHHSGGDLSGFRSLTAKSRERLPNWPADIAAAWPLFEEIQQAIEHLDDQVLEALDAATSGRKWKDGALRLLWVIADLSPRFICAWWLALKLECAVEIVPDGGTGEEGSGEMSQ